MAAFVGSAAAAMDDLRLPVAGPALEDAPGPVIDSANLPPPARWPALRHDRPLRLLAIMSRQAYGTPMQLVARRLHAPLETRFYSLCAHYGADIHVLDFWEQRSNPTSEELKAHKRTLVSDAITLRDDGSPPFDAIFVLDLAILKDTELQGKLLACANAGGIVVICGSAYPAADTPLGAVWPVTPAPNNACLWMSQGSQRADGPELSGLPLERLAGHTWIPIPKVAEGAVALSDGQSGSVYSRAVGKGRLLFVPTGPISRVWNAIGENGRRYDHDGIWLRLWDNLLHELARGQQAFPAYSDLRAGAEAAPPAAEYVLPGKIVNRAWRGPLALSVHVTTPRGIVVYRREEALTLAAGETKDYAVRVPVAESWAAGLYPVCLTIGDPDGRKQIHQSMQLIPVAGSVELSLASAKRGYRLGEDASFTATLSGKAGWAGTLCFAIYDFRGRLLAFDEKPVNAGEQMQEIAFTWRMADHGVKVDTLWAAVAAACDGQECARAEVVFYRYEPWSMRNEYQWSAWSNLGTSPPSIIPRHMRLMAHAGLNALGFSPGELYYLAERWGMRSYDEGIGINTSSPVIECENDTELEASLAKELKLGVRNRVSATFVLGSVGEEAGYKTGWGKTYYWDEPVASDKACKAFQWFLKGKYPSIERLNAVWKTAYASWDDVKLTKEFSGRPPAPLMAGGSPNPENAGKDVPATAGSVAPYSDTELFYAWYYDKIIAIAKRVYREKMNPVTRMFSSAPASWIFDSRENDVRNVSPSVWQELQTYSTWAAPEPCFGLTGLFEFRKVQDNQLNGFLFCGTTHQTCWVDVPVHFNNDATHTRASFAMRRWNNRLAGREGILLDRTPRKTAVGILPVNGIPNDTALNNLNTSLAVALLQSGYGYRKAEPANLAGISILFAPGWRAVSAEAAKKIDKFVNDGGLLVMFPRFASQSEYGEPQAAPGGGLAEKWGLAVKPATVPVGADQKAMSFDLRSLKHEYWPYSIACTQGFARDEISAQAGWQRMAAYGDGVPALLARQYGRGRLFYVNANYQSHRYIQWVTPTDKPRQSFYRLVEWLCGQTGERRDFRFDGNLAETLHMAAQQFTDRTGEISYVLVGTGTEGPWVNGVLNWFHGEESGYDVLGGEPRQPAPMIGRSVPLNLPPGMAKLLAFTRRPVDSIRIECAPAKITAGEPVAVTVHVLDADRDGRRRPQPIPGSFPVTLRVVDVDNAEITGLRRAASLESGGTIMLNTALSDPPGPWMITVTDGISGRAGTFKLRVSPPNAKIAAPAFAPWGWPSEVPERPVVTEAEFIERLRALARVYQTDHSGKGWQTKMFLGYYNEYFPGTRHDIMAPLCEVDWPAYADAIARAVEAGETFILTGEDLGIDPATGLAVNPHHDAGQLSAIAKALSGARWHLATADGDTVVAILGKGRVLLCRESIDAAGNTNAEQGRWQTRWLAELAGRPQGAAPTGGGALASAGPGAAIRRPDAAALGRWWIGRESLTGEPRRVTWLGGDLRETVVACEPDRDLPGQTFTLVLPPTGVVTAASLTVELSADSKVTVDVGCDGTPDGEIVRGGTAGKPIDWPAAINGYIQWREHECGGCVRNGSNWRIVPVRITSDKKVEVTISKPELTVQ